MTEGLPGIVATPKATPAWLADAERAAACALSGLGGIGEKSLALLLKTYGSLAAAVAHGGQALAKVEGLRSDGADSLAKAPDLELRGRTLLEKAAAIGAKILLWSDDGYPAPLRTTTGRPPVLYVLGEIRDAQRVAVVGSRASDPYGLDRTRGLVAKLCQAGIEVVSGGAEGVDTAAHTAALDRGGRTLAVVGTGLLTVFPTSNRKLFDRIAQRGAIISEFALDAGGQRQHFPQRNRTMAGLSHAVVLTRGTSASGALSTCDAARKLNRPIFAVPGMIGDPQSAAANGLLSRGEARALVDGNELLLALNRPPAQGPVTSVEVTVPADLGETGRRVLAALGPAPRHVDELAEETGLKTSELLGELLGLEIAGLCHARPGKYFQRR